MKTLFTLLFAALCLSFSAHAQRFVNLAVTASFTPTTYAAGQTITMSGFVQNVGTTPTKITDTILYGILRAGNLVTFSDGTNQFNVLRAPAKALAPNDTINIGFSFSLSYNSAADSIRNLCVVAIVVNQSADSVADTSLMNNVSCTQVTELANFASNIHQVTGTVVKANTVGLYPNPANENVTFNIGMNSNSDVAIRVFDMSGRLVIEDNKGRMAKGDHAIRLNTDKLRNGLYVYQVVMGSQVETGKFSIIK